MTRVMCAQNSSLAMSKMLGLRGEIFTATTRRMHASKSGVGSNDRASPIFEGFPEPAQAQGLSFRGYARRMNSSKVGVGSVIDRRITASSSFPTNGFSVKPARTGQRGRSASSMVVGSADGQKMVWGLQYSPFDGREMKEVQQAAPPIVQMSPNRGGAALTISECQADVWGLEYVSTE